MRNNVKNSLLLLTLLMILVLSISCTFAQNLDDATNELAVYNNDSSISIENQNNEYNEVSIANDGYATNYLSVTNNEEILRVGEVVESMPQVDTGVVSGGVDCVATNPGVTSGSLVYTIPEGMTNLKSAIVIVNVYSGSGASTYALYSNVTLNTKNGLEELGYEALWLDKECANDPNVYAINDHTTKQYSDYQMVYNITNKVNTLTSGDTITIRVNNSQYLGKLFDGRIKLISLLFAFDDGDDDNYNYWLNVGQLWTQDTANFNFNTGDYTGKTNNISLRTIALSSSLASSYKINNVEVNYDSSSSGFYYNDIKWNNISSSFNKGNKTNFWYQNGGASYKTNVALLIASESETEALLTEVYVDYVNGNDDNIGTALSKAFKTISHALSVVEDNGIININGVNYLDNITVNGLNIDKNISIIGLGNGATIDANNTSRIFNIGAFTVNLSNLIFINGNASGTNDKRGGALWVNYAVLNINNCKFINNTAGMKSYGAAINLKSSNTTINNSEFDGNTAGYCGGAINAENNNILLNITGSTFTKNGLPYGGWSNGGAICSYNTVIIDKSLFYDNILETGKNGKSINQYGDGSLTITNSVLLDGDKSVYVGSGSTTLKNNWWGNNDTAKNSNPKDLGYTNANVISYLYLNMTMFASGFDVGDTASVNINLLSTGDEINIMDLPATLTAVNGSLNKDTLVLVNGVGSAEYTITGVGDNSVTVHVLSIEDTYSLSSGDVVSSEIVYVNSTGGSDSNSGVNWDNAFQTIEKAISNVDNNGTIYVADGLYQLSDSAPKTGIVINKNITIIGQSVNAVISGGNTKRIFIINVGNTLNITSLTLTNGKCNPYGGAIFIDDAGSSNQGHLIISDSIISNSNAENGGAIGSNIAAINNINNVTFINNSASSGGALFVQQINALTIGDNCKFINNTANGRGSVIYARAKVTTGRNNLFCGNIANGGFGFGAIFGYGFEIGTGNVFINNRAKNGGALYLGGSSYIGSGSYCIFINSTDNNGRPVAKQKKTAQLTLNNCYWGTNTPNFSALCNGAITYTGYLILNVASNVNSLHVGDTAVVNVDLTKNQNGETVDIDSLPNVLPLVFTVENGNVNPVQTELVNGIGSTTYSPTVMGEGSVTANINTAAEIFNFEVLPELGTVFVNYTGGLDTNNGSSWANAVKTLNRALEILAKGKTIYVANGNNYLDGATANGLTIDKNLSIVGMGDNVVIDANNNGRIFNIGAHTVYLSNLIFINGNASSSTDKRGGALYANGTALNIDNCKFINNTAGTKAAAGGTSTYGGAINLKSSTTTITNSEFNGNSAWSTGAGINAENSNVLLNISDSRFTNNLLLNNSWSAGAAICAYNTAIINKTIFYGNILTDTTHNGKSINEYGAGSLTITNSILLDGEKGVWIATGPTTLKNNWWGNNDTTKYISPKDLGFTNADVESYLVLSSTIRQDKIYQGDLVTVTTTLDNCVIELPIALDVNLGTITPNETNITTIEVSTYNATTLGDVVITIDVLGIKNKLNFTVKETLPNVAITNVKTQWGQGIYPAVNNTFTITLNNGELNNVEGLVLKVYSNETGELIASYTIESLANGTSSIFVTDPTIRPLTEESVWPAAQDNKIKFTFNLMKGEDLVSTFAVDKMLAYNGYFNKSYAYGGHNNIINKNYTISGDIIIATQDVSLYSDQFTRFRNETWNIETPENAEIVKVLLYFNYNWDTSYFPNGWNLTFNGYDILNHYLTHETDRGNLGGWGAYNYGLLVFDVTDYYKANENNSFVINKTGNCALYPSTLYVLYNITGSSSVKDVYFTDICDVFYPNYNKNGYDDLLKTVVYYNNINIKDMSQAMWYVFTGSSSMNNNLTFNNGLVVNPFADYTSNDCRPYMYNVTSLIENNNEAWFITCNRSSTTVAYEQVLVVERMKNQTYITVVNDTVYLSIGDEFNIGAILTPNVGELTYSCSNESIATVENGTIIAKNIGTAIITVSYTGNEYYTPSNVTVTINVGKKSTNIIPNVVINKEYYPGMVTIIIKSNADGIYNVTVGDDTVEVTVADGLGYKLFIGINAGIQNATVSFLGNEIYFESTVNKEFEILKESIPNFSVEFGDATYPDDVSILINGPSGTYTVKFDDTHSTTITVDENNIGIGSIGGLAAGTYNDVNVTFGGNKNTEEGYKLFEVTVKKLASSVTITPINETLKYLDSVNITYTETNGGAIITVKNEKGDFTFIIKDNKIVLTELDVGTYIITAIITGNDNVIGSSDNTTIHVNKVEINPVVTVNETLKVGEKLILTANVPNDYIGGAIIEINGKQYAFDEDIQLFEGNYDVKVIFAGDNNYNAVTVNKQVNVTKVVIQVDDAFNMTTSENDQSIVLNINLPNDATGFLLLDVDGEQKFVPLVNGNASLNLPELAPGNYSVTLTYTGDKKYNPITTTKNITVNSNVPDNSLTIPETSNTNSPTYSINLPIDATGYLEVDVDGTKYVSALNNGFASVTVPYLSEGTHNVTVTYTGDSKYSSVTRHTTLNVHIPVYKITKNKNIITIYSARAFFKILITKDGKAVSAGEKITIKYNNKIYTVKTNNKGYATLKLNTKLKVKKYTITTQYKGVKVTNKVTIQHIIKANNNNKVKKSKKVTKVKVSLKKVDGKVLKAKKLKIKFKGKTYKVKTNKKGFAIWKVKKSMLKKLKVGKKYKYKVTYGKDALTKKLTIKK